VPLSETNWQLGVAVHLPKTKKEPWVQIEQLPEAV
jgi:hypothetical protein